MKMPQQKIFFWLMLFGIYGIAWQMQSVLYLRSDISILLHEAMKLLAGGTYAKDFYETNPPLILYLSLPAVLLMKWFHISIFMAWRLFVFFLASISLFVCTHLIKKIFNNENDLPLISLLLLTLSAIFLILPLADLGQRDALVVIFSLPYLLLLTSRLEKRVVGRATAVWIGLFAAIGFSIKPHYLIAFVLLELYSVYYLRSLAACLRIEVFAVVGFLFAYLLSIFIFHSDYVFVIVPMVSRIYYSGLGSPWRELLFYPSALYSCLPVIFFMLEYPRNSQKVISTVFLITLMSYLIVYLMQETVVYYHILPALSMAVLLSMLLLLQCARRPSVTKREGIRLSLLGVLYLGFMIAFENTLWITIIFYHWAFYGLFAVLFLFLFYLAEKKTQVIKVVSGAALIVATGYLFSYFAQHTDWFSHRFLLTTVLMVLMFSLFVSKAHATRLHFTFVMVLGLLMFAYPFYIGNIIFSYYELYSEKGEVLVHYMHTHAAKKSVYFISAEIAAYPFIDYAEVSYASRYPLLIWVPSLVKQVMSLKDKTYYLDSVSEELNTNKPFMVFVDIKKENMGKVHYDFVASFSENPQFKNAWRSYRYITTVEAAPIYKLAVYQRIS